jgi:hypothetical protein
MAWFIPQNAVRIEVSTRELGLLYSPAGESTHETVEKYLRAKYNITSEHLRWDPMSFTDTTLVYHW